MSLSSMLDKIAQHQRPTAVKGALGGNSPTWSTVNANVPVAAWPAGSMEVRTFKRRDWVGDRTVVTDRDLGALPGDRLLVGGKYYLIHGVLPFENTQVGDDLVYTMDCSVRTV